jgi:hypothetical protein
VCLASGNYGSFAGAAKSGPVTVAAAAGAAVSMSLKFTAASNLVIDGVTITGSAFSGSTKNITVRNSAYTAPATINGLANANVLFDRDTFLNIEGGGQYSAPARIHLSYSSSTPSGVTIQNSLLSGGSADGVQTGVGVNILNNEFVNIYSGSCTACHTDAIQMLGAKGSVVRGNYIHDSETGIVAYDGLDSALIEDNVVDLSGRPWGIELYSDNGSIVRHNTLGYGSCAWNLPCGIIAVDHKAADPAGTGTVIVDNIATEISIQSGSTVAQRRNNLLRRNVASGDLTGIPSFLGGADPNSYEGFRLTPTSPGNNAATDGSDTGI